MPDLLFFLLLGHFCGDFALQSDEVAILKNQSRLILTYHVAFYTLVITFCLFFGLMLNGQDGFFSIMTVTVLAIIFAVHWLQDFLKGNKFKDSKQAFYADQAIHVLVLFLIRITFYHA